VSANGRSSKRREICDKSKCRSAFQSNKYRLRYPHSGQAFFRSRKPHQMGIETSPQSRPTCLFANAPLNILGGSSWHWPNKPRLDAETRETIRHREIAALTEMHDYVMQEAA
jgi:hypothetical protein